MHVSRQIRINFSICFLLLTHCRTQRYYEIYPVLLPIYTITRNVMWQFFIHQILILEIYFNYMSKILSINMSKGKAIPVQTSTGPLGSRRLRLPEFLDYRHKKGGKIDCPKHRLPLTPHPVDIPGTHFCYMLSQPMGHSAAVNKKSQ